jgi:acetylornithine deacetylase
MSARLAEAIELTKKLVRFPSVSNQSNEAVSQFVADRLAEMGFEIEWLTYQDEEKETKVSVVAKRGSGPGGIAYLAHTDVVPAEDWSLDFCGPFDAVENETKLYGRGACDMKGSLAAALTAASSAEVKNHPLYFVVTSDEEVGMQGAAMVNSKSKFFEEMVANQTTGIIGEPTSLEVIHAHKGGERFDVIARGVSAHTSTRDGSNANYKLIPILQRLLDLRHTSEEEVAYQNTDFDPPTLSWNMTITNEPEAVNVTPSLASLNNFFRSMPNVDHEPLLSEIKRFCRDYDLEYHGKHSVKPWSVEPESSWVKRMLQIVGRNKSYTVCYATDAGVLQRLDRLVVCGPGSIQQAHRSDEWISFEQLERGVEVYKQAFETDWRLDVGS